jgi:hypothetical protein
MKETSMPSAPATITARELAHRYADGVHVTLVWHPSTDRVMIEVFDEATGETFEFEAPAARALDAFWHPYAYAAFAGIEFTAPSREPVGV